MSQRIRALNKVENTSNEWEHFNSLFGENTSIIDDIFNRGVRTQLASYVRHKDGFEEQFCKIQLDPIRQSNTHRLHILAGKVGRGKSTFIDYCRKKVIPEIFHQKVLQLFIDANTFHVNNTSKSFGDVFIEEFERQIVLKFFNNISDYRKSFVRFLGFTTTNEADIVAIFKNEINKKLFEFIIFHI